jgi:DNA-binding MarR family transcriptional regulator
MKQEDLADVSRLDDAGRVDGSVPATHHTPDEILAHSQFAAARTAYIEGLFSLYENNPFMNRLLIEATRSLIFFNALSICAAYDPAVRGTWPTIGLLKQAIEPFGVSTERRVDGLISQFVDAGYLTLSTTAADRRVRFLIPTQKMIAHDLEWIAVHYRPLQIMFPETGYAQPMGHDLGFQKALRIIGRQFSAYAAQLMAANPAMMFFMERDAGTMILLKLVHRNKAEQEAQVSFTDLADRFGVSRTHVRKIIQEAERRSLLQYTETTITLAPTLLAALDRFVADTMSGHDLMYQMAVNPGH